MITVRFTWMSGLTRRIFRNARLAGSWNGWTETPMTEIVAEDGCPAFTAAVDFPDTDAGRAFQWGVRLDASVPNVWAINTEVNAADSSDRHADVTLPGAGASVDARYYFTVGRHLGAQKRYAPGSQAPALGFAVWAPHARRVDVVFGTVARGYIADDGSGIDPAQPIVPLVRGEDSVWDSGPVGDFAAFCGLPYMFRIENAQGQVVYRTDLHSRWQIGRGDRDPARHQWDGTPQALDGTVSCSVVIDQDVVRREYDAPVPELIPDDEFWATEFTPGRPVPTRLDELVIYELHVGSLGFPGSGPGTLGDACALLDYLDDLGVNAIELLPVSEFSGNLSWGYGDTHHFVIESSAGGRDKYKYFVRDCHRRGMAVIQDVVYNHFDQNAERAEWAYDSTAPDENVYYWYEGRPADYASPEHGYVNNGSSGWTPRFHERPVRQLFLSSAAQFVEAFHVDGLRVDLTQAIHRDNSLNVPGGRGVSAANLFGQKLLREWSRTLKMIRPSVLLIAEDHTGWDAVTRTTHVGGLGFDATWFAAFYHHLIGDSDMAGGDARLLRNAGFGNDEPLAVQAFAGLLWQSGHSHVVYHESHDEAGNAGGTLRTSRVAVNDAPLVGDTRTWAEARCRVAAALSLLSAGTPMFFMGEEIVAQNPAKYNTLATSKEDLRGERTGEGARMFRFYQDLIRLRRANAAVTSHHIDIVHVLDTTRVLAFTRREAGNELLIVASLSNRPFDQGYVLQTAPDRLPDGLWQETFNSDAAIYGGRNVGNAGAAIPCTLGRIELRLPAAGLLVLQRT